MATYLQNILNDALGDGARASKFDVDIILTNNELFPNDKAINILAKATNLPSKSHEIIDLKYKGRSIPVKGQTKYDQTWSCTFYLAEDHKLKNAMEVWLEALDQKHNYVEPRTVNGLTKTQRNHANNGYPTTIRIIQKNIDNTQNTAIYTLFNVFPTQISTIDYSADSVGQLQEFSVTFAYSHYTSSVLKGAGNNFVDDLVDRFKDDLGETIDGLINAASEIANDAIGGALKKIESSFDIDLNNLDSKVLKSSVDSNDVFGITKSSMKRTIEDVTDIE